MNKKEAQNICNVLDYILNNLKYKKQNATIELFIEA
jgi:hypothetical protein